MLKHQIYINLPNQNRELLIKKTAILDLTQLNTYGILSNWLTTRWESLSQQEHTHFITMFWSSQGAISIEFTPIHWISFPSCVVFCRIKVNLCVFLLSASLKSLPQWVWIQSRDSRAATRCGINQNWCFKLSHSKSTLYSKECIKQKKSLHPTSQALVADSHGIL